MTPIRWLWLLDIAVSALLLRRRMSCTIIVIFAVWCIFTSVTAKTTTTTTTTIDHSKWLSMGKQRTVLSKEESCFSVRRWNVWSQPNEFIYVVRGGGNIATTESIESTNNGWNDTTSTATAISSTTKDHDQKNFSQKQCDDRSAYVKDILHRRHVHVQSGRRLRDIRKWMKRYYQYYDDDNAVGSNNHPDGPSVLEQQKQQQTSIVVNEQQQHHNNGTTSTTMMTIAIPPPPPPPPPPLRGMTIFQRYHPHRRDPFPIDRRNLNFDPLWFTVPSTQPPQQQHSTTTTTTTPISCFVDTTGEMSMDMNPPTIWQLGLRMTQLLVNFAPMWSTMGIAVVSPKFRQRYWYKWITNCIGVSGAAWIKWGQWSATRNDMFPEALCDELSSLHASAPAHPWSYSALTIEQSLGLAVGTLHCVFDEIDIHPIASGSIAQVHKAVLCGRPVALKIRHPNVRQLMEMDFRLMTIGASIMDKIPALSWLHIRESVEQFSYTIAAQAHLQVEAHHLEVLNYNFRNWPRVSFPKPIFASPSTIIETFEAGNITTDIIDKYNGMAESINAINDGGKDSNTDKGITVIEADTDVDMVGSNETSMDIDSTKLAGHDLMPVKLAKFLVCTGVSLYLKMLLIDNLMHADLHPGNIMVETKYRWRYPRRSAKMEKRLIMMTSLTSDQQQHNVRTHDLWKAMDDRAIDNVRITLVDAGMVVKLTDEESSAFIGLLSSLGEGNGDEAAAYTLQFSLERNSMTVAQKRYFAADMVLLFQERCRGYGTNVDVGYVLRGVLSLIRKHRVRIDANFATLVINCLCMESLGRRVCPTYNVLDAGRPLLQGYRQFVAKRPESSPWFSLLMTWNAFKKDLHDRLFFRQQAKQKYTVKQSVENLIQGDRC